MARRFINGHSDCIIAPMRQGNGDALGKHCKSFGKDNLRLAVRVIANLDVPVKEAGFADRFPHRLLGGKANRKVLRGIFARPAIRDLMRRKHAF